MAWVGRLYHPDGHRDRPTVFGLEGIITDKLKLGNEKMDNFIFYCVVFGGDWL